MNTPKMMKNLILLLMTCLMTLPMSAQEVEHMTFMGIPIDGKIKSFQSELKKKGFANFLSDGDKRVYKGIWAGNHVMITVGFDNKTKIVHSVTIAIPCYTESNAADYYDTYKRELMQKYKVDMFKYYGDYYMQHSDQLAEDIKTGTLDRINSEKISTNNSVEETTIYITKPMLVEGFDTVTFASVWFCNLGNVGRIKITRSKINTSNGILDEYNNSVFITYIDGKNIIPYTKKREEEL